MPAGSAAAPSSSPESAGHLTVSAPGRVRASVRGMTRLRTRRDPAQALVLTGLLCALVACGSGEPEPVASSTAPSASASAPSDPPPSQAPPRPAASSPPPAGDDRQPTGEPVTMAFGGDVHFEGSVRSRLLADPGSTFDGVDRLLRRADLAMVNLETAVTDGGDPEPKEYVFRAPQSAWRALEAGGVDVVSLANNHGLDFGAEGLEDTLEGAERAGMPLVGAGQDAAAAYAPWRTTVQGQRIAVLGATQVLDSFAIDRWAAGPGPGLASAKREDELVEAVRTAREGSDTVVVMLHWGVEGQQCPQAPAKDLAQTLVQAGADVVVGSHAHVLQGSGYRDGAYVHYGLGNFLFYSSGGGLNTRSGVLTLTLAGRAVTDARWDPAVLEGGRTTPLTGSAAERARAAQEALRDCTGLAARP